MADSKKIILLEDDKASARLVSTFLESKGYDVRESYEGRFAIEMALKDKPDLLIADVLLPDMHGSEAVKQLRASSKMNDLKVLFLTSLLNRSATAGQETRLTVGGREYPALSKPFKPAVLASIVEKILSGEN
ncbi:response regulator [Pelagicoccus sp. SDUM812003]|uniref:response regulator n=1 Tax=Pelagicoccus sp. SDUM812003 TaxID=3041267 RepID=UPI00280D502A|nr:response regulator [Pelagicoccus sp. SDUM812003]MDQ8201519.1 response regulator [Pelagicoccus sp. SDUM812003]